MAKPRRDVRPIVYGILDLVFASIQLGVIAFGAPNRHGWAQALMLCLPAAGYAMGIGTLLVLAPKARAYGWRVAVAGAATLLVLTVIVLGLLLASAAFLAGVYGSFGRAAASGVLAAAALVIEMVALLPAFQLKYLLTRAGRRAYGQA